MLTRSKSHDAGQHSSEDEGDAAEQTIREANSNEMSQSQLDVIIKALAGIKKTVQDLHEATCQSQKDIVELRTRIETDTANTCNENSSVQLTALGPLPAQSQTVSIYRELAAQPQALPPSQSLSAHASQRQSSAQAVNFMLQGQSLQSSSTNTLLRQPSAQSSSNTLHEPLTGALRNQSSAQSSNNISQGQSLQSAVVNAQPSQQSTHISNFVLHGQSQQSSSNQSQQSSSNQSQQPAATTFSQSPYVLSSNPPSVATPVYFEGFSKLHPLPIFDGNPEEWPLFRASYIDSTIEFRYSNRQNLMRLQKALQGSAKHVVSSLLIFPENVPLVMEELQFNFGRPELLIKVQMQKVKDFPNIYEGRLEQVLDLCNRVRNMVAFFKSANCDHHLLNPMLLDSLVLKLPASKQFEWSRHAATVSPFPTVQTFALWLSELARVISAMPSTLATSRNFQSSAIRTTNNPSIRQGNISRRVLLSTDQQQRQEQKSSCVKCKQHHALSDCQQFKALNVRRRWDFVKSKGLCFCCMQNGHSLSRCQRKRECGIDRCHRMHNQLLHQQAAEADMPNQSVTESSNNNEHLLTCHHRKQSVCLFKILPVVLIGPHCNKEVYAILDEGSSVTLLEEAIANELGAKGRLEPLALQWYNQERITEDSCVINIDVKGVQSQSTYQLKNVRTVKGLDLPVQTFVIDHHVHLRGLPIANYVATKPSLLIGLDNCRLSIAEKTVSAGPYDPIAISTKLGWVAYGPSMSANTSQCLHVRKTPTTKHLHQLVDEYFSLESVGVKIPDCPLESIEDTRARNILKSTTRSIGSRYEVGLLWSEDNVDLPRSYEMAKRRLVNVETKMSKDERYAETYKAAIQRYIDKGYAQLMSVNEASIEGPTTWYLPHFGVVNHHKPNKLRVVFDAAATVSNVSLNSYLLKGPEQARPLMSIMYKFRQRRIAVAGDIEDMFSQIKIRRADRDSQRFLWRDGNQDAPIQIYVMTSMVFGAACSPCCAEHVKNINAAKFHETLPRGEKIVIENTYVDDLVVSFDTPEEAKEVIGEAISINKSAGFNLRNFVSNCKPLQHQLNNNNSSVQSDIINMEHQPKTDKILGMYWDSTNDTLEFHFRFQKIPKEVINNKRSPTKRELLGLAMAIYDPFGLISNVTIGVKLLLQDTWRHNLDWDDQLTPQLALIWEAWWRSFQWVRNFAIPRCLSSLYSSAENLQLHLFVDASDAAYAAVAYLRILSVNQIHVAFVASKAKCAPKKATTIPRLELQAAVLGNRLRSSIEECLDRQVHSITFWSDSQTVLHWIRSTKRDFKQFVSTRISEILSNTTPSQWRWVPSALNVADDATKVKSSPTCDPEGSWIKGPDFLYAEENYWPAEPQVLQTNPVDEEPVMRTLVLQSHQSVVNIAKYSSLIKLLRVVAWIQRFVNNLRHTPRRRGELVPNELIAAEQYVCRQAQNEYFATEINILRANKCLSKSSPLFQLTPKLDTKGILRIHGRIDAAYCLPESARSPIILPQQHYLSLLVLDYFHQKNHHQNSRLTINEMRQQFWIPNAHALLKNVQKRCPVCIRQRAKPTIPLMGQLPADRLTPFVRPFSYTGVDYCGPFFIAVGRSRQKRWIALFTCLTTRAIHLEVAADLSTDAFLICLRNFVNRRGVPVRIRSDNGTNFIGAQHELKKEERMFDFETIQRETSKSKIEWKFSCPVNPAEGGCWERLIQCVKRVLQRVLKEEAPRLETFHSVVIEAENIVNSRPLTDIPLSPQSSEPLTPNHFLLGCCNSTQTPSEVDEKVCLRKQWKIAQNLKDRLWKRWIHEYLPQLLTRSKWHSQATPLQPGQLVLVCDPQLPRGQWQTGRVIDIITSKDAQVRSARVRTSTGIIRRPASKLAALEFVNPDQDSPRGGMSAPPMCQ